MNSSVFKISLDIHKPESQDILYMKRLDASRAIHISLTENGRPYQITPDCSAVFTARKPDGNPIYNDCRIEGNVIIYDVTQQTVSCVGETGCEIRLFNNEDGLITSPRFSILVDYTIYNGEEIVESAPEFDALQQRIEKSDKLYDKVNNAYENGEFKGEKGEQGEKGDNGADGAKGQDGADGISATHSWNDTTLTITSASGTSSADLKGAKGDKGDKGEKGETGLSGIPAVHTLPTNSKDGDLILYAPINTLTSTGGKRVYFDWAELLKPIDDSEDTTFNFAASDVLNKNITAVESLIDRYSDGYNLWIMTVSSDGKLTKSFTVTISNGVLDAEGSTLEIFDENGDTISSTSFHGIDELPLYIDIPEFDLQVYTSLFGNAYLFHTEYRLMKYQGGEWIEAIESGVTHSEMAEYVTAAINGSLDEIEAMIDESGVLDE